MRRFHREDGIGNGLGIMVAMMMWIVDYVGCMIIMGLWYCYYTLASVVLGQTSAV